MAPVHLEMAGVQEQIIQPHPRQVSGPPGGELRTDRRADPADGRLRQRGLRTQDLSQGGLDVPVRQATHPPRDHQRLQRIGPGHPGPEQPRTERLVGAAQLGPLQLDRAHRRLDRHRRLVTVAAPRSVGVAATLVPGPAQELRDLGLQGGLEHQPHAEPGDLLKDRREVTVGAEQLMDLGADALDRRYSSCHGCRSSFVLGGSREPTPVAHLHQRPDTTASRVTPVIVAPMTRRFRNEAKSGGGATFRLRAGCSASNQMAPDGSGLLTLDGPSVQTAPDGQKGYRRIVWMIKRMIKGIRQRIGCQGEQPGQTASAGVRPCR